MTNPCIIVTHGGFWKNNAYESGVQAFLRIPAHGMTFSRMRMHIKGSFVNLLNSQSTPIPPYSTYPPMYPYTCPPLFRHMSNVRPKLPSLVQHSAYVVPNIKNAVENEIHTGKRKLRLWQRKRLLG